MYVEEMRVTAADAEAKHVAEEESGSSGQKRLERVHNVLKISASQCALSCAQHSFATTASHTNCWLPSVPNILSARAELSDYVWLIVHCRSSCLRSYASVTVSVMMALLLVLQRSLFSDS